LRAGAPDALASSEAVLSPDGTLLDARGPAEAPASRRTLGEAARTIAHLRRQRRSSIEPTGRWFPRVSGRWTLVDTYAQSGQRYIVARENQCHPVGLEALTEREQQVVVSAASGKTNKEVAYELGISHSTTRVLLSRACARLGVRTRAELFALPGVRALRGLPADD
jgi:DNA-binding NarL/FixJ family response regulator